MPTNVSEASLLKGSLDGQHTIHVTFLPDVLNYNSATTRQNHTL